jgi:hypothetical protein
MSLHGYLVDEHIVDKSVLIFVVFVKPNLHPDDLKPEFRASEHEPFKLENLETKHWFHGLIQVYTNQKLSA